MPNQERLIASVLDLVMRLGLMAHECAEGGKWDIASLALRISAPEGSVPAGMTPAAMKESIRLAMRIINMMAGCDDPRFSMYDYADAIANAARPVSIPTLLALGDGAFAESMAWLAGDKREAYEGREHVQDPLEYDIREEA